MWPRHHYSVRPCGPNGFVGKNFEYLSLRIVKKKPLGTRCTGGRLPQRALAIVFETHLDRGSTVILLVEDHLAS